MIYSSFFSPPFAFGSIAAYVDAHAGLGPCPLSLSNTPRSVVLLYIIQAMKTGTTIAGIVYKDGVVLGADTRATGGTEVADKNCEKIHYLAPNIYCCGAGTAADTEKTTELIR